MSVSSRPHPCAVVCVGRRFVNQAAYAFAGASPMPIDRLVVADCIMPIEEIEARRRALLVYHSVIFSTAAQSLARSAGPDFAAALLLRLAVKDLPPMAPAVGGTHQSLSLESPAVVISPK